MAEVISKTLNTRISLKYDLYSNWSTNNPVLLKGEVALAYVPADATLNEGGAVVAGTTPPNVMMKVGDGTHHYNDLKFTSAIAADVAAWAKAAVKPEYTATEIKGLEEFIAGEIEDTDTQYSLVKVTDYQYKLMSKTLAEESFTTEVGVINIPKYDDTKVKEDIAANAAAIALLNGEVGEAGSVKKSIADAITALNLATTYAPIVHTHAMSEVTGLEKALADAATEAANKATAAETAAKEHATGLNTAMNTRMEAVEAGVEQAQGEIDALEELVGTLPTTTDVATIVEYVDKKTAGIATDAALGELTERVLQAEKDIQAVEDDYLKAADKNELQGNINTVAGDLAGEVTRATNKENEIAGDLSAYKTANDARVLAVEGEVDVLQETILGLTGAMHFRGAVETLPTSVEGYVNGDVVVVTSNHKEYVCDGSAWIELGDEGSHITKTEVANTYETKADATSKQTALNGAIEAEVARAKAAEEANAKAVTDLGTSVANTYETKTDAATKASETLAAAKEDATTKANAAQAAAEATAAADATAKADAAKAAAEKTATDLNKAMDDRMKVVEAKPAMGLTADQIAGYDNAVTVAGTAVQNVTAAADSGLKATRTGNNVAIAIDETVTFVFDCGTSVI